MFRCSFRQIEDEFVANPNLWKLNKKASNSSTLAIFLNKMFKSKTAVDSLFHEICHISTCLSLLWPSQTPAKSKNVDHFADFNSTITEKLPTATRCDNKFQQTTRSEKSRNPTAMFQRNAKTEKRRIFTKQKWGIARLCAKFCCWRRKIIAKSDDDDLNMKPTIWFHLISRHFFFEKSWIRGLRTRKLWPNLQKIKKRNNCQVLRLKKIQQLEEDDDDTKNFKTKERKTNHWHTVNKISTKKWHFAARRRKKGNLKKNKRKKIMKQKIKYKKKCMVFVGTWYGTIQLFFHKWNQTIVSSFHFNFQGKVKYCTVLNCYANSKLICIQVTLVGIKNHGWHLMTLNGSSSAKRFIVDNNAIN